MLGKHIIGILVRQRTTSLSRVLSFYHPVRMRVPNILEGRLDVFVGNRRHGTEECELDAVFELSSPL